MLNYDLACPVQGSHSRKSRLLGEIQGLTSSYLSLNWRSKRLNCHKQFSSVLQMSELWLVGRYWCTVPAYELLVLCLGHAEGSKVTLRTWAWKGEWEDRNVAIYFSIFEVELVKTMTKTHLSLWEWGLKEPETKKKYCKALPTKTTILYCRLLRWRTNLFMLWHIFDSEQVLDSAGSNPGSG